MRGEDDLAARLAELDAPGVPGRLELRSDLQRFVEVLGAALDRGTSHADAPVVAPHRADALAGGSALLARLDRTVPSLSEPSRSGEVSSWQEWLATRRPDWLPARPHQLDPAHLLAADSATDDQLTARVSPVGLWTSTAMSAASSMWRLFVAARQGGPLWRRPWRAWRCVPRPDARVLEVASATDWAAVVERHHVERDGLLHPDWRAVSSEADAVHFAPRAIAAIDGYVLETGAGLTVPTHVTVESTLWLRWSFTAVDPLDDEAAERSATAP